MTSFYYKIKLKNKKNKIRTYETTLYPNLRRNEYWYTSINSVRLRSISNFSIRWLHRTGIKTGFAYRTPASTHLVGASVETVLSAPVGWVGLSNVLLTPNDECQKAFELNKEYLFHPPILVPPQHGKTLTPIPLYHRGCGWKYACTRRRWQEWEGYILFEQEV